MKVLIADDEPLALQRLRTALACIPEVEVVAAVGAGVEASKLIRQLRPELVILDVEMPDRDGLSVVADLTADLGPPEVIFVTAYRHYAVQAFDLAAIDYLTKPVAFERLRSAVRRAEERLKARAADVRFSDLQAMVAALQAQADTTRPVYDDHLWIRRNEGMIRIEADQIELIEAQGDYVLLHLADASHLHRETLTSLETRLDPGTFVRCHRSTIVNLAHVRGVRRRRNKGLTLSLADGRSVAAGPAYVERLSEAMRLERWRS